MIIVITGNPGVGKHTSAQLVAETLCADVIDINKVALDSGKTLIKGTGKGLDVDVPQLSRLISGLLREKKKGHTVLVGHIAPYVLKRSQVNLVIVLRRSPYELVKTLHKRGYSKEKVKENAASEILGVTLYDAIKAFGKSKIIQIDTTGKVVRSTAQEIVTAVSNLSAARAASKKNSFDWLTLVSKKGDLRKFFDYDTSPV